MADPKPIKTIATDQGIGQDPPAATDAILKEKANGQPSWCTVAQLIPAGGSAGQALTKIDGVDFNYTWAAPTAVIADDSVTLAKQAHGTANRLIGYNDSGVPVEIAAGSGISITDTEIAATGGGGGSATLTAETVDESKTYATGDFPTASPLYILVEAPDATPVVLTFPAPETFSLTTTQARILAYVRVSNANAPVSITLASGIRVRSQPGTTGWSADTTPVYIGASQALSDEAVVTVSIEGGGTRNVLLLVDGIVRASA